MNLVAQRNEWRKQMEEGTFYSNILEAYKQNRHSELWKTSETVERLCEYILFLEHTCFRLKKELKNSEEWVEYYQDLDGVNND